MTTSKVLVLLIAAIGLTACTEQLEIVPADDEVSALPESKRLHQFREIRVPPVVTSGDLSGTGVRIAIVGEIVDPNHPDLEGRIAKQFNSFVSRGELLPGIGSEPMLFEKYGANSGHGTHIAGIIAANCDGKGIQGIACGARMDVYDIGVYEQAAEFVRTGWDAAAGDSMQQIIIAAATAIDGITNRGISRIATGSFNIETPAVRLQHGGPLQDLSMTEIRKALESHDNSMSKIVSAGLVRLVDPADAVILDRVAVASSDEDFVRTAPFLQKSLEWRDLTKAIARFQRADGVYITTESNNLFEDRSSLLNALPSLASNVDPGLWLSVVLAVPSDVMNDTAKRPRQPDQDSTTNTVRPSMPSLHTPLNTCGRLAADYCILTPSYDVSSTMTEKVAERGMPLFRLDERDYQIFSGHSMGAPMVAATLALMEEKNQRSGYGYDMKILVQMLKTSANRQFPNYDRVKHGWGMLDVTAALEAMDSEATERDAAKREDSGSHNRRIPDGDVTHVANETS